MAQPSLSPHLDFSRISEDRLLGIAAALGAAQIAGLIPLERQILSRAGAVGPTEAAGVRGLIQAGHDPLGEAFCFIRSPEERRPVGATYTPQPLVSAMAEWASLHATPERVVDPGVGSGRFLLEAGRRFPRARLIGVDIDPVSALLARANLAAAGFRERSEIHLCDYRALSLPAIPGKTLFIGNPPYVRHHLIAPEWKAWLTRESEKRGLPASQLAGLHVHFFLATLLVAKSGDYGIFITAAEWLEVNYGRLVRELLLSHLGGRSILVVEPTARPFPDAAATAAITTFEVGTAPRSMNLRRVESLEQLGSVGDGVPVLRERFATEHRWGHLSRTAQSLPEGFVELGELCRVHRGQVTGANRVWIAGEHSHDLPPAVLFPTITKAREVIQASGLLADAVGLRCVIDLPVDLDVFDEQTRKVVARFLKWAKAQGAHRGYIATHRKAWWSVGLRKAPPILATYMARRPPAFAYNLAAARYINIAHGIYPREPMSEDQLRRLAGHLAAAASGARGRTYAGGLMKFEPREMSRIAVPRLDLL